jgi:Zn-dependent protease with chaperone function
VSGSYNTDMPEDLTPASLTLPRERTLFVIVLIFSCLVWLVCVVTIAPMVGLLIAAFVIWFGHGLLIGRIKSEAVKLDINQTPGLSQVFTNVCARLNVTRVPDLYLMQAGGVLNAFATRFCARDFVVLYSDILEAYGADSGEIRFLLGHEIGHIRSKHIFKNMVLLPGLFLPLLGSAYNRACESSCDRHGSFASEDEAASVRALMILSGGKEAGRNLLAEAFSAQHHQSRGFFVSLHELFSSYPTLSKRVSDLLDLQKRQTTPRPPRNPFAYLLALFVPGARFGILGVAVVFYIVIISFGMALPMVQDIKKRTQEAMEKARLESENIRDGRSKQTEEDEEVAPAASPLPR